MTENKGDLISREALKKAINDFYDNHFKGLVPNELITYAKAVDGFIDNAPTELFPLTVKIKDDLTDEDKEILKRLMKDCKPQVLTLETERPQCEWIRLDLAKRVIAKFEGYLDDDMIARIQIALEKENEAEMKGGADMRKGGAV